jgi:hypothetical protein
VDVDIFGILIDSIYAIAALLFVIGLLLTASTGRTRPVKIFLALLNGLFTLLIAVGFFFTPFVIFLLFQIIALILVWDLCVVVGAVCGGGIYSLLHKQPVGKHLVQGELGDYLPLAEFAAREGIDEERALARIRSGYYRGGSFGGAWYVHASEQSQHKAP